MNIILFSFIFLSMYFTYKFTLSLFQTWKNPIFIMHLLWGIHFCLSLSGLNEFYSIADGVKIYFLCAILLIPITVILFCSIFSLYRRIPYTSCHQYFLKSNIFFPVFVLIHIPIFLYTCFQIYQSGFNLQALRDSFFFGADGDVSDASVFGNLIPIFWLLETAQIYYLLVGCYNYFIVGSSGSKLLSTVSCIITYQLASGGRTTIIYLMIILMFSYLFSDKSNLMVGTSVKIKKYMIFMVFLVITITLNRADGEQLIYLYNNYIKYFVGPFVAMDKFLVNYDYDIDNLRFGLSIMGLDTVVISGVLRFLAGLNINSILSAISYPLHHGVMISDETYTNAHYTALMPLIVDFKLLSPIVFQFYFVIPVLWFYFKFRVNNSFYNYYFLVMFSFISVFSFRTSLFMEPKIVMALLFVFIFSRFRWSESKF